MISRKNRRIFIILLLLAPLAVALGIAANTSFSPAVVLLLFFILSALCILLDIHREKDAGEKQLHNIRYILDVEKELFDAHMHPEHFTVALRKIADYLNAQTAFLWLAYGSHDVQQRLWFSDEEPEAERDSGFLALLPGLYAALLEQGGYLSYTMENLKSELPAAAPLFSRFPVQSLMLFPVSGLNGELPTILGAWNLDYHWKDATPLEQVSLSFSMAINHYKVYQTLNRMGKLDSLTGLMNRNSYHAALSALSSEELSSFACIYIDTNGLHEINNHLGHQAGDAMLKTTADTLRHVFSQSCCYRIGGDEFVVLIANQSRDDVFLGMKQIRQSMEKHGYPVSIGAQWQDGRPDIDFVISCAEKAMQEDKQAYYRKNGKERQMRSLNHKLEQLLVEKQDADAFLSVIAPEFKGVYFVDLASDTIRHLYIPSYFEEILRESGDRFSAAILLYAQRIVKPEYFRQFEQFCDYAGLQEKLSQDLAPEFTYQKNDGEWLTLRVLKFKSYAEECQETLWIFANAGVPDAAPEKE